MENDLFVTAYPRFFEALNQGGLAEVCRIASELLAKPVVITDAELKRLAQFPDNALGNAVWDSFLENGELSSKLIWQLCDEEILGRTEKSAAPFWANWGTFEDLPSLFCTVKIDSRIEGYISVLFPEKEYSNMHVEFLKIVTQAVRLELMKQRHTETSTYSAFKSAFVRDLFRGSITSSKILRGWERRLKKELKPPFAIAVVSDDGAGRSLHYAKYLVGERNKSYKTVMDNKLYILFTEANPQHGPLKIFKANRDKINGQLKDSGLVLGISNLFHSLLHMDIFKYQAERSLMLGRRYAPQNNVHWYTELIFENMISHMSENLKSYNYMHPLLETLDDYDQKNNTEYLKTLKVYITSMCSTSKTVERMHIHRNTLLYRLKKIEELTDSSLDNERLAATLLNNFYLLEDINLI